MISSWLDDKYINLLSFKLDRFKRLDSQNYNFRCPFCGDSKKNRFKARGNVFPSTEGGLFYKCFNCGIAMKASTFIERVDDELYKEYRLESLKEKKHFTKNSFNTDVADDGVVFQDLTDLKKVSQLNHDDPVKKYVLSRKIPAEYHHKMYYAKRFMEWINKLIPDKFDNNQLKIDEPRLVIPFFNSDGYIFAVAGRSFKENSIKYLTIKFNKSSSKVFGLDELDRSLKIYIVEGPIDSYFIDNSLAFAGIDGNIKSLLKSMNYVIILDNQPRNDSVVNKIEKLINENEQVFIWPPGLDEFKDINDLILGGYSKDDIKKIIDKNTYQNLVAKLKFNEWKKTGSKNERYNSH